MLEKEIIRRFRSYIRDFEDRRITAADLSREIFHVAREVADPSEAPLRRRLETLANRANNLVEGSLSEPVHAKILQVVDDIEYELTRWGY